jgi:type IV secretion system protein TrbF
MFRRSTVRYGRTPEPETPYQRAGQRAGQAWDERIGSARVQAKNWRLAFFGALILSGGLSAGIVWQSARGTVTPWVVQVDKLGQAQAVAPAIADYRPTGLRATHRLGGRCEPSMTGDRCLSSSRPAFGAARCPRSG